MKPLPGNYVFWLVMVAGWLLLGGCSSAPTIDGSAAAAAPVDRYIIGPGDSLEISWDEPHRDDPRPHCVQLWGGLRMAQSPPEDDIETRARIRPVAILPSAANLVLVYPYPVPPHGEHDERAPCGEDQAGPDPTVGST